MKNTSRAISLLVLLVAVSFASGRRLNQQPNCSAFSSAGASSESRNAVVTAVSQAFAFCSGDAQQQCTANWKGSSCESTAVAQAKAVAQAFARAVTSVYAQVASTSPTCVADASALASAKATATALAQAYGQAVAQSCNNKTASAYQADIESAVINAASQSQAFAQTNGVGNAEAANTAFANNVVNVIAESISAAVAACKCGTNIAQAATGANAQISPATQQTGSASTANTQGGPGSTQAGGASGGASTSFCVPKPTSGTVIPLSGGLQYCP